MICPTRVAYPTLFKWIPAMIDSMRMILIPLYLKGVPFRMYNKTDKHWI
jgi:hypothetical protein